MSLMDQNAAILGRAMNQSLYEDYQTGITGRYTSSGTIDPVPDNELVDGYIWVRIGNNRSAEACLNVSVARAVGVPVITAFNKMSKQREVIGVDASRAVMTYGGAGSAILNTPTSGTGASIVKALQFEPGLVLPDTGVGGLAVTIRPFWYNGIYVQQYTMVLTPTSTSGKTSYVCVYYDPATETFGQTLTTDRDIALITDIATTIASNLSRFWLVAIALTNGASTIDPANAVDLRFFNDVSAYYQTVQDDGSDMTQRSKLNFIAGTGITIGVADNSGNDSTDVTITAGSSGSRYLAVYNYRNGTEPKIGLATSNDGRTFTRLTEPLLTFGSGGAQDDTHLAHPCLVENAQGHLYLYYGGWSGTNYAVMLARSFDRGATWTKYASNPVLDGDVSPSWENSNVSWARVLYDREETDSAKRWKMWYLGDNGAGGIGYAYSSDGLSWTKFAGNPVVTLGTSGQWDDALLETGDIIRLGDTYYLFYGGSDATVNPTWSMGYVTFTDPEGTYTRSADNPILVGDGILQDITSNVSIGDTSIPVTSAAVFPIGAPVWIYDNSSVTNKMLTTVTERIDSTHIRIADPATHAFTTAQVARVRSAAYNSVVPIRVIYDKGWLFTVTAFQPEFWTSNIHEISMFAFSKDLSDVYLDYGAGMIIPITADESDLSDVSFENPYIYDRWRYSDRTQVYPGDPTAIHTDVASEIAGLTQKATPVSGDFLLIEDSADGNAKKYIEIGDLPTGSFAGDAFDVPYTPTTSGDWSSVPTDAGAALDTLAADLAATGSTSPYTAPPTTGWSWLNQGTSTINSSSTRQYLEAPADATFQVRARYRDQPTVPYTITAAFKAVALDGNCHFGFVWYDGTTEVMTFGPGQGTSDGQTYRVWYKWTDYDSLNSSYFNTTTPFWHLNPVWLRISDDNTNIKVYYSADGENFIEVSSQTRTDWLTPSKVGFFIAPGATNKASVTLLSWEET